MGKTMHVCMLLTAPPEDPEVPISSHTGVELHRPHRQCENAHPVFLQPPAMNLWFQQGRSAAGSSLNCFDHATMIAPALEGAFFHRPSAFCDPPFGTISSIVSRSSSAPSSDSASDANFSASFALLLAPPLTFGLPPPLPLALRAALRPLDLTTSSPCRHSRPPHLCPSACERLGRP
jgi:hypothetical protein